METHVSFILYTSININIILYMCIYIYIYISVADFQNLFYSGHVHINILSVQAWT